MAVRDWIGAAMRRVGLHRLSGWWDAGTDANRILPEPNLPELRRRLKTDPSLGFGQEPGGRDERA